MKRFLENGISGYALMAVTRIDEDGNYHSPNIAFAGGIQTQVNVVPAPGIVGSFYSENPRYSVPAGPGGIVAGAAGLVVGRFAWLQSSLIDPDNAPIIANNFGLGAPAGILHNENQGLITTFLADASLVLPGGFMADLLSGGDLWVTNDGTTYAQQLMKAYANLTNGKVSFAATGSPTQAASTTASIAASTFSVTGSIAGNVMTVTAVGSGVVVPGATISGTGVSTGNQIVSQLSGTAGGIGTYAVSIAEQAVAAGTTISGTYGTMTVTAVGSGTVVVGGILSGTNVVAGTQITALGTGTGGNGTYIVNNNTVVVSTTITETLTVETKWIAMSGGAAGEIVKLSAQPLG